MAAAFKTTPWSRLSTAAPTQPPAGVRTVLVIGAGPSGLVAAKHLRDAGFTVSVVGQCRRIDQRLDPFRASLLGASVNRSAPCL